jgi:hypothetical protein
MEHYVWLDYEEPGEPDNYWVGGTPHIAPDGTWVGGTPMMAPNGKWVGVPER